MNESEQIKEKNTIATVGMRFSIIWLIAVITVFLARLWLPLLLIGFILWIIGLFYKPRGKARVAVIIPVIVGIAAIIGLVYVKNSIETPATEFATRIEDIENNEIYSDIFKEEAFWDLLSNEFKETALSKSKEELNELYDASTGSNALEKWSYVFFGLMKESIENSLEKYGIEPQALDVDEENIDEEIDEDEINEEEIDEESIDEEDNGNEEESKDEIIEITDNWEQSDIEEIIDILE